MLNLTRTADYLAACLKQLGFIIMSEGGGNGLPLVAFRLNPNKKRHFDEFAVAHQLRERGWVVPAYTMAPDAGKLKLMRVVVREDFSKSRCDALVTDIKMAVDTLEQMEPQRLQEHTKHTRKHVTNSGKASHNHPKYRNEKHSLQGKTGKVRAQSKLYYHKMVTDDDRHTVSAECLLTNRRIWRSTYGYSRRINIIYDVFCLLPDDETNDLQKGVERD